MPPCMGEEAVSLTTRRPSRRAEEIAPRLGGSDVPDLTWGRWGVKLRAGQKVRT